MQTKDWDFSHLRIMREEKLTSRTVTTLDSHIGFKSRRSHKPSDAITDHDLTVVYLQGTIRRYRHLEIADKKGELIEDRRIPCDAPSPPARHGSPRGPPKSLSQVLFGNAPNLWLNCMVAALSVG